MEQPVAVGAALRISCWDWRLLANSLTIILSLFHPLYEVHRTLEVKSWLLFISVFLSIDVRYVTNPADCAEVC